MRVYELIPTDGRKSFYHKARVEVADDGTETLISYNTPVLRRNANGTLSRLWAGWTATTGRHVAAFAGLNKKAWDALPVESGGASCSSMRPDMSPAESYRAMMGRRYAG